jgi:hypothetical protein
LLPGAFHEQKLEEIKKKPVVKGKKRRVVRKGKGKKNPKMRVTSKKKVVMGRVSKHKRSR